MSDLTFLPGPADWWRQAVVYQIYPRSFADSDGDGLGDLRGITAHVDHLVSLGIDAVWLNPFYPSQLADGGYDVDDHRAVDPRLGTLEDFDELVRTLHGHGIRIFVDIVPNHSSNRHRWFLEALASEPGSPARERYIFRDGRGERGQLPPSDLVSAFGPDGWERTADGQWYLHLFAPEQPDFNWAHPDVHEEFLTTLRFWADRGVDGFRVDVAHALVKQLDPLPSSALHRIETMRDDGTDALWDRDAVHDIYREWRKVFDEYDPPRAAVAEAWVHPHRRHAYASPEGLGQAFNFDLVKAMWDLDDYREIIARNLRFAAETGSSNTWVLSNHDVIRHATRLTLPVGIDEDVWYVEGAVNPVPDPVIGLARARAATLMILALPGSTYLYQGEELGLPDYYDLPRDRMQDPQWFRGEGTLKSRDGCRVPIPWTVDGPSFGFSSGEPHLPQPASFGALSVEAQEGDPASTLALYRAAISLRSTLQGPEELGWLEAGPDLLAFERPGGWVSVTNFGAEPRPLPDGEIVLASAPVEDGIIPGYATAWLLRDAADSVGSAS